MNRLTQKLDKLSKENNKALVAYLEAGDPDMDSTLEIMHLFVKSGVDIIEVGVPFTDPIAEGPLIQRAHDRAIRKKVSLEDIFDLIEKFRSKDDETPLVLMGYLNSFIFYKNLIIENKNNSVDSILVVDIPGELKIKELRYPIKTKGVSSSIDLNFSIRVKISSSETFFLIARSCALWIIGPSAIGSVKGTPTSIISTPDSTNKCIISSVESRSGSPATRYATNAFLFSLRSLSNFWVSLFKI